MSGPPIDHETFLAILECIASFTVGIAVNRNTGIGTGTLVRSGETQFVLTAEHVIRGVAPAQIRFWCRPSASLVEKSARDVVDAEIRTLTAGETFPIETVHSDTDLDLAIMTLRSGFALPGLGQFFDLSRSRAVRQPHRTTNRRTERPD